MTSVRRNHQTGLERLRAFAQHGFRSEIAADHHACNAFNLAAQMKSLIEIPPTEWVLKRTVQAL